MGRFAGTRTRAAGAARDSCRSPAKRWCHASNGQGRQGCDAGPTSTSTDALEYLQRMPKVLYLATEDWFFCQHFLPMGRAATKAGFEVTVAARRSVAAERIVAEGFTFVACDNDRGSFGLLEALRSVARMAAIVRAERPDIVHCISIRMALLGGAAARFAGVRTVILAPTGLGHLWLQQGIAVRLARAVTRFVIGRVFRRSGTHFLFENLR